MTSRRGFILGLGAALAAPAIVRAESIMQIAVLRETVDPNAILIQLLTAKMAEAEAALKASMEDAMLYGQGMTYTRIGGMVRVVGALRFTWPESN